ncbi:hypothetical protein ACOME3_003020 [Neoechinorhynchus agilis]
MRYRHSSEQSKEQKPVKPTRMVSDSNQAHEGLAQYIILNADATAENRTVQIYPRTTNHENHEGVISLEMVNERLDAIDDPQPKAHKTSDLCKMQNFHNFIVASV